MRFLRTYRHVAQIEHWCDRCCDYIDPGEFYEGSVYLYNNHRLVVFKNHIEPDCDYPPDPDDEIEDENIETMPMEQAA